MQGHHEFNPKEASTFVIAEESPSFYNQNSSSTNNNAKQPISNNEVSNLMNASEIPSM